MQCCDQEAFYFEMEALWYPAPESDYLGFDGPVGAERMDKWMDDVMICPQAVFADLWNVSPFAACGVAVFLLFGGLNWPLRETLWVIIDWLQPSKHGPNPQSPVFQAGTHMHFPFVEGRSLIPNGACSKWMLQRLIKIEVPPVVFSYRTIYPGGS